MRHDSCQRKNLQSNCSTGSFWNQDDCIFNFHLRICIPLWTSPVFDCRFHGDVIKFRWFSVLWVPFILQWKIWQLRLIRRPLKSWFLKRFGLKISAWNQALRMKLRYVTIVFKNQARANIRKPTGEHFSNQTARGLSFESNEYGSRWKC